MTKSPSGSASKSRDRLSSVLLNPPLPQRVERAIQEVSRRWPVRELAAPPTGSGLKPVIGDQGLPLVGHTLDYIRFGSDLSRERYERFGSVSWMGGRLAPRWSSLRDRRQLKKHSPPKPRLSRKMVGGVFSSMRSFIGGADADELR